MSPVLEYVMTPNPTLVPESTVVRVASVMRDSILFASIYYAPDTDTYVAVFSYRVDSVYDTEAPYSRISPAMSQDVVIQTSPQEVNLTITQMANLEFRPL